MSELAAALADTSALSPFDGRAVIRTQIAVTNAGDGLSNALKIEPREFRHGEVVYVVLECEVSKVGFVPVAADVEELSRVHTFKAQGATIVDAAVVRAHLDEQAERIRLAHEQSQGIVRLPYEGDEEEMGTDEEGFADPLAEVIQDPPAKGRRSRKASS